MSSPASRDFFARELEKLGALITLGREAGYTGPALDQWIKTQQAAARQQGKEEREAERKAAEAERKEREEERKHELALLDDAISLLVSKPQTMSWTPGKRWLRRFCTTCCVRGHAVDSDQCPSRSLPWEESFQGELLQGYHVALPDELSPTPYRWIQVMADTEAQVSLISRKALPRGAKIRTDEEIQFEWIDGNLYSVPSVLLNVKMPFLDQVTKETTLCRLGVVDQFHDVYQVILGRDLLKPYLPWTQLPLPDAPDTCSMPDNHTSILGSEASASDVPTSCLFANLALTQCQSPKFLPHHLSLLPLYRLPPPLWKR
ncbi:uncharacterized protein LOC135221683 [Macrobrachium nipponense]|uniref:uncharacterized protein LOC135221683 n=1 Tax=Macrobrachium nipponense TaxID=159736 RepID=UPI0030C87A28